MNTLGTYAIKKKLLWQIMVSMPVVLKLYIVTKKKTKHYISLKKKKKKPGKASGAICPTRTHAVPPTDQFDTKLSHVNPGPRGEKLTVSQAIQNFSVSNVTLKTVKAPRSERRYTARRYCA